VDIVRRRTQVQRQRPDPSTLPSPRDSNSRTPRRSASSGSTGSGLFTMRALAGGVERNRSARRRRSFSSISSMSEDTDAGPVGPVDEPYSQQQPRSQFSLHRAATIAANSSAGRNHLRALPTRPLEYRRADGLREMPHESDADNWVPPPPAYTAEPDNIVSLPITPAPGTATGYVPRRRREPAPNPQSAPPSLPQSPPAAPRPAQAVPANVILTSPPPAAVQDFTSVPRARPHSITRPPGTTQPTQMIPRRPVVPREGPASPLPPPMPGFLNSPMTFPQTSRSPRGSTTNLTIPPQERVTQSTPASPATHVRRDGSGSESPVPTPDQVVSLHRRSGSGGSAPRAALGAYGASSARRPSSIERMRPLPRLPPEQQNSPSRSNESPRGNRSSLTSRRNQRPVLNRLATITSITSHPHNPDDPVADQNLRSAHTTPETPTGRRQWWRLGSNKDGAHTPGPGETTARPTSSRSGTALGNRPKEGSFKCVMM
jgi:hypothetical protein